MYISYTTLNHIQHLTSKQIEDLEMKIPATKAANLQNHRTLATKQKCKWEELEQWKYGMDLLIASKCKEINSISLTECLY